MCRALPASLQYHCSRAHVSASYVTTYSFLCQSACSAPSRGRLEVLGHYVFGSILNQRWLGPGGQIAQPKHPLIRTNLRGPIYPISWVSRRAELWSPCRSLLMSTTCIRFKLPYPTFPLPTRASWDHHLRERLLSLSQSLLLGEANPDSSQITNAPRFAN